MIEKMHEMYKYDKVTIDILKAVQVWVDEITGNLNDIEQQRLLDYTSWYLIQFENELGIKSDNNLDKRHINVRNKLLTRGKVWVDGVADMCSSCFDSFTITYKADEYCLYIISDEGPNDELKDDIRAYVPAHIYIVHVDFLRVWQEAEIFTWGNVEKIFWSDLREKMEI